MTFADKKIKNLYIFWAFIQTFSSIVMLIALKMAIFCFLLKTTSLCYQFCYARAFVGLTKLTIGQNADN